MVENFPVREANVAGDKSDRALADRIAGRVKETMHKSPDGGMRYSTNQRAQMASKVLAHGAQPRS